MIKTEPYGRRERTIQKYLQIRKNNKNRYLLDKSLLKSLSNRELTISNPGLIHRSTNNFHENRKQITIQESFQSPKNFRKSRRIVGNWSRYSTLCRTKLR